tara:strand:+ start:2915 stop:3031 length:117 start_codon:yes stop_codon:yes gene_type:complete
MTEEVTFTHQASRHQPGKTLDRKIKDKDKAISAFAAFV